MRQKKRVQLGVIISRELKARLVAMARESGQSQGQVAERLMLQAVAYERLIAAFVDAAVNATKEK